MMQYPALESYEIMVTMYREMDEEHPDCAALLTAIQEIMQIREGVEGLEVTGTDPDGVRHYQVKETVT